MIAILDREKYHKDKECKTYFCWEEIDFCVWDSVFCNDIAVNCSCFFGKDSFSRLSGLCGLLKWLISIINYTCASTLYNFLCFSVQCVFGWRLRLQKR